MYKTSGYTLIEILIVMVIISIVGTTAIMTISHNQNSRMEVFAKQLTNTLLLAEQKAMLQPAILGFAITSNALQFYRDQETTKENPNPWRALTDPAFGTHTIPEGMALTLKVQGKIIPTPSNAKPQIIISTNGDLTPFAILIGKPGAKPRYQVIGEDNGSIRSEKIP